MPFTSSEVTELCPLTAADPQFKDFKPDDYKAYIRFRICTSFPNVIGPEMHGRFFGFHPQVLVNSYQSLLHQQTNLGHMLKIYGAYRDRIQGSIVGVTVSKGGSPLRGAQRLSIPEKIEDAVYLDCTAVLWKMAEGNKELLGKHMSAREKTNVSIEVGSTVGDLAVYHPEQRTIMTMQEAMAAYPGVITRHKKNGIQIGQVEGIQLAFAAGGESGTVPFRGVGYTPNPAEWKTAKVIDLAASLAGEDIAFAARIEYEWEAGMPVWWPVAILGSDAGGGIIKEVIMHGNVTRHRMTKTATPADPLLLIKCHGKQLEVIRHASSVKPSKKTA